MMMNNAPRIDDQEQLHLFLSLMKAGRKQQANDVLKRVLEADFSKAGPYALLVGGMLAQNGQYREAVPLYQEAIQLTPADPTAYFFLGVAYHALKEESECERIWDELATRFPEHATAYYQRALRSLKRNRHAEAKADLERAVELIERDNPLRADALKTLAAIEREMERQA
jgi:tetratricopeptide (TPR) repeat protein